MSDAIYDPDQVAVEVLVDGYASGKLSLLAGQYRFSGKDPKSLCRKNAKVHPLCSRLSMLASYALTLSSSL